MSGGGIWMLGGGLASDNPGRMFFATVWFPPALVMISQAVSLPFFLPCWFSWRVFSCSRFFCSVLGSTFPRNISTGSSSPGCFFLSGVFAVFPFRLCSDSLRHGVALAMLRRAVGRPSWPRSGMLTATLSFLRSSSLLHSPFFPPSFLPSVLPPSHPFSLPPIFSPSLSPSPPLF